MTNNGHELLIGIISDTHGYLHPKTSEIFKDADMIIHAGDIGDPEIIDQLREIAPVHMVKGNMDDWACDIPETEMFRMGSSLLFVLHDLSALGINPAAAGIKVVISGHTHQPSIETRDGILYINPGSAGKFQSSSTVVLLHVNGGSTRAEIVELK